ncbi:N-formimino-L-glutamate deiminase [compost metagenome]
MQLDRQAQFARRDENLLDLRRGKRQVLAEGVHGIHQPLGGQRGQHLVADVRNVVVGATGVFRRQGVGSQAGGAHGKG